ncbi:MAG: hypothetical protein FWH11_03745 [Micrococcales bacterium]|nr:hypothetical protein [Micrococcales bacterium]
MSTIAKIGTSLWALGLAVTTIAWATGHLPGVVPVTCLAGILFGLSLLWWLHRHPDQSDRRQSDVETAG